MSQRCTATSSRTGRPCRRWAIEGGTTCPSHGSSTASSKAAAARRLKEQAARSAVVTLGLPVDIEPAEALLQEVQWTAGHIAWLRERIQTEDGGAIVPLKSDDAHPGNASKSVWYRLYQEERAHLVRVGEAVIRAGVEEREVRLAEAQGDLVIGLIRRVLDGLYRALIGAGLTDAELRDAWSSAVADVVPREVRALAGAR